MWVHLTAAAAAKSLQLCPTLRPHRWQPTRLPPSLGFSRQEHWEWVAISFSNAWKSKVKVKSLSRVWLFAIPWTTAYQGPPSMGFSRQECWSGVPLPSVSNINWILSPLPLFMPNFCAEDRSGDTFFKWQYKCYFYFWKKSSLNTGKRFSFLPETFLLVCRWNWKVQGPIWTFLKMCAAFVFILIVVTIVQWT